MRRKILPYNRELKQVARALRNNSIRTERLLWRHLKGRQMLGFDLHRQKPLNEFVVDFYCSELMLAIEVDGDSHAIKEDLDRIRQQRLEAIGVRFLRFEDRDVKMNLEEVLNAIAGWIVKHTPAYGDPSREG